MMATTSNDSKNLPPLRRIITGHTPDGLGTIQSDAVIHGEEAFLDGIRSGAVWTTDSTPSKDTNNDVDGAKRSVTGGPLGLVMLNGTNLRFTDLAPGTTAPMHRTSSVDYNILISGKLILVTDDGSATLIEHAGDVVVQRGNMHAWINPGPGWTRWVSVLVDAEPASVNGRVLSEGWLTTLSNQTVNK